VRLSAILRQRCPRCLRGAVFGGLVRMLPECPACGLHFEREPGYFLGAMYYSYALSLVWGTPVAVAVALAGGSVPAIGFSAAGAMALLSPVTFRFSRVLWLHMDQAFDPR
jgi:hypothetical protein